MSEKKLPDEFYATVISAAAWSKTICYAAEKQTGLHFYVQSVSIYGEMEKATARGDKEYTIPIIVRRKKGLFGSKLNVYYYRSNTSVGIFYGICGGGPPGDFFTMVPNAY